jgi:hypothetical protein
MMSIWKLMTGIWAFMMSIWGLMKGGKYYNLMILLVFFEVSKHCALLLAPTSARRGQTPQPSGIFERLGEEAGFRFFIGTQAGLVVIKS